MRLCLSIHLSVTDLTAPYAWALHSLNCESVAPSVRESRFSTGLSYSILSASQLNGCICLLLAIPSCASYIKNLIHAMHTTPQSHWHVPPPWDWSARIAHLFWGFVYNPPKIERSRRWLSIVDVHYAMQWYSSNIQTRVCFKSLRIIQPNHLTCRLTSYWWPIDYFSMHTLYMFTFLITY